MNIIFKTDLAKRKEYLNQIVKSKPSWKFRMALCVFLMIMSISIFVGIGIVLISAGAASTPTVVMAFMVMAVCLACVPFFIGISVKNTAKYICGAPYSGMTNGTLMLEEKHLEYIFWKASKETPAAYSSKRALYRDEDKFVYRFAKDEIKSINIDDYHICHIVGKGTLTVPIWETTNDTIETTNVKKLDFLIAFEQSDADNKIISWRYE